MTKETMAAKCERYRKALEAIRKYPSKSSGRADSEGYPAEVVYDEFAYKRMVDSYRNVADIALKGA